MINIDNDNDNKLILEQIAIEDKFMEDATTKYENSISRMASAGLFSNTSEGSILQKMTVEAVADQMREYFNAKLRGHSATYLNFLRDSFQGREEVLSFVIIQHLLNFV